RTISLCERASASAGGRFSVGSISWDWRVRIIVRDRTLQRDVGLATLGSMPRKRLIAAALLACAVAPPAAARASATQVSIMQDDDQLVYRDDSTRDRALDEMKALGVDVLRATVLWRNVAAGVSRPAARRRDLSSPRAYG